MDSKALLNEIETIRIKLQNFNLKKEAGGFDAFLKEIDNDLIVSTMKQLKEQV